MSTHVSYPAYQASRTTPQHARQSREGTAGIVAASLLAMIGYALLDWGLGWSGATWPVRVLMFPVTLVEKWDFLSTILVDGEWSIGMLMTRIALYVPLKIGWGFPVIGAWFMTMALSAVNPRRGLISVPLTVIVFTGVFGHFFGLVYARSAAADLDAACPALTDGPSEGVMAGTCELDGEERARIAHKLHRSLMMGRGLAQTRYEIGRYFAAMDDVGAARDAFDSVSEGALPADHEELAAGWVAALASGRPGDAVAGLRGTGGRSAGVGDPPGGAGAAGALAEDLRAERLERFRDAIPAIPRLQIVGLCVVLVVLVLVNWRSGLLALGSSVVGSGIGVLLGLLVLVFREVTVDWSGLSMLWIGVAGTWLYLALWAHLVLRAVYPWQPVCEWLEIEPGGRRVDEKLVAGMLPAVFCLPVIFCGTIQAGVGLAILGDALLALAVLIAGTVIWFADVDRRPHLSRFLARWRDRTVDCLDRGAAPSPDPQWRHDGTLTRAGLWRRFCAHSIDAVFLGFVVMAPLVALFSIPPHLSAGLWMMVWFKYSTFMVAYSGQTLGMRVLGIAVVGRDGRVIGVIRSATRFWAWFFFTFVPPLGIVSTIVGLVSHKDRMLHDMVASTYVVRVRQIASWRAVVGHVTGSLQAGAFSILGLMMVVGIALA